MRAPVIVPEMLVGVNGVRNKIGQGRRNEAPWGVIEGKKSVHFRVLLGVHHSSDGDTEVGDRAPEV